jgi:hypothetical protein
VGNLAGSARHEGCPRSNGTLWRDGNWWVGKEELDPSGSLGSLGAFGGLWRVLRSGVLLVA